MLALFISKFAICKISVIIIIVELRAISDYGCLHSGVMVKQWHEILFQYWILLYLKIYFANLTQIKPKFEYNIAKMSNGSFHTK